MISPIDTTFLEQAQIRLFVKREDLNHTLISGNKWWKLKYNLLEAKKQNQHTLLTFGGAHSNHIYAMSAAARENGFKSIGIIRGEELTSNDNSTLRFAEQQGMRLHFVTREEYRKKAEADFINTLHQKFGDFYLIPEGGTNELAVKGVMEWTQRLKNETDFDYVCCACGTGGTLAGLIWGLPDKKILGFSSLKGDFLSEEVRKLAGTATPNWSLVNDYHFGGYAKYNDELLSFINDFEKNHSIPVEHIYTGKMFYGLFDLIKKNYFPKGCKILAIHTGGLQGRLNK